MDGLLKEFEALSLPSRVNWNDISETSIDRVLTFDELKELLRSLKEVKGNAFQWRKLREASLISLTSDLDCKEKLHFLIQGKGSIFFSLENDDLSECHIAMSKLIALYEKAGEFKDIVLILLFRFYYANDLSIGMSQVCAFVQNTLNAEERNSASVRDSLELLTCVVNLNVFGFSKLRAKYDQDIQISILLDKISQGLRRRLAQGCCKAYPVTSVTWIGKLLSIEGDLKTELASLGLDESQFTVEGEKVRFRRPAASIKS